MAPNSPIFLDIDDSLATTTTTNRRHRSNEDLDFLKEEDRWRRHDQARQMVRYRDKNHFGATTQQRTTRDHLAVPVYEVSSRRPRAKSDTRPSAHELNDLQRDFRTLEVRPSPRFRADDEDDDARATRLEGKQRGSTQSRDPAFSHPDERRPPKIKIPPVVIQEHPPDVQPRKSPRSSSAQYPQLQYKYLLLQNKLADITLACIRYIEVEPADPRDLTFEKISEQVKGFAFELRVWHHVSNIEEMGRMDVPEQARGVLDACARGLERMGERAEELCGVLGEAGPGDLKLTEAGKVNVEDGDDMFGNAGDGDMEAFADLEDPDSRESTGYIISSSLHSIKLQIQNLKRLSRSLQDATPGAKQELAAVSSLVGDVSRYFGSDDAMQKNGVDKKFSGRRALQEARWAAGQ